MKRMVFSVTVGFTLLLTLFSFSSFAQGKFVYTNNDRRSNNSVTGFKLNGDGSIERLPGMPKGTDGGGGSVDALITNDKIVVTEKGPFLFLTNDGDQEVASFNIDPETGGLSFIGVINLGEGGNDDGMSLAVGPNEDFLYVGNPNNHGVHALRINNDGTLTALETEPLGDDARAVNMMVSPDGRFLAVRIFLDFIDLDGQLAMFAIAPDGLISPVPGSPFNGSNAGRLGPVLFNCESSLLFVGKQLTNKLTVDVFSVAQNGSLSLIEGAPFVGHTSGSVGSMVLSPDGKHLFADAGTHSVSVMDVEPGGQMSESPFSPFGTSYQSSFISDLAIDGQGKHVFASFGDQHVESLKVITSLFFALTPVQGGVAHTNEDDGPNQSRLDSLVAFPLPKKCQIITPDDVTVTNEEDICGANVDYPPATTCGDDCGTVTCEPPAGTFFAVGTHTVICSSEGADDAEFKITVEDKGAPTISCPKDITVNSEPNKCSAVVHFMVIAKDNCGSASTEVDHPSGSTFPKGVTTVNIKATDDAGNESFCSFKVTVVDAQAPAITCKADIEVNNEPGKCGKLVTYELPNVSDNCPGVGVPVCNPPSGTFFPIGMTNVICVVKDEANNEGQCSFKVNVIDVEPPSIVCPADKITVTAKPCDAGVMVSYPAPTVMDNCPNDLMVICSPASGSIFPVGATTVSCVVTDGGGNEANCSFKVTIFDVRLQDDSNPQAVLLFNSFTGEYRLCCPSLPQPVTGQGTIMKVGCVSTLQHNAGDRKLLAKCDPGVNKGSATYQSPPGQLKCTITDKDISNNTSLCQ